MAQRGNVAHDPPPLSCLLGSGRSAKYINYHKHTYYAQRANFKYYIYGKSILMGYNY